MAQHRSKKGKTPTGKSSGGEQSHAGGSEKRHNGRSRRVEEALPGVRERREAVEENEQSNPGIEQPLAAIRAAGNDVMRRTTAGVRGAGRAAMNTVREHPVATSMIGAGLAAGIAAVAIGAAQRPARGKKHKKHHGKHDQGLLDRAREAFDSARESAGETVESVRESAWDAYESAKEGVSDAVSELGEYAESGLHKAGDALKNGAAAVGQGVERGYEYSREKAGDLWENHPLLVTTGFLALGLAAGMLLPLSRAERKAMGRTAGKVTNRVKSKGRELLEQGKELADRVASETTDVLRSGAAREGLSPEKVARKVKRIAGRLKDVVTDVAEG